MGSLEINFFFFSSRRRHTRCGRDWNSDVCSSDLLFPEARQRALGGGGARDQGPEGNIRTMSDILERLADVVESRKAGDPEKSYVSRLFARGPDAILKKVGEEATEAVIAAQDGEP